MEPEPDALRTVCQELDYLLRMLVNRDGAWNVSCDGIDPATDMLPEAIEVPLPCELRLRGRAYWLASTEERWGLQLGSWITPFLFWARVTEEEDVLSEYLIQVGNAGRGMASDEWGKRLKDVNWFYPEEWIFTFCKPASIG